MKERLLLQLHATCTFTQKLIIVHRAWALNLIFATSLWCKAALERELVEDIIVHLDVCEGRCQGRGRERLSTIFENLQTRTDSSDR